MNNYRATVIVKRMEQNSCRGKREYLSMREASDVARIVGQRSGQPLIPYECPFCCLFHVGHPKSRRRLQAERKLRGPAFDHALIVWETGDWYHYTRSDAE
jgi:hypothetical protein